MPHNVGPIILPFSILISAFIGTGETLSGQGYIVMEGKIWSACNWELITAPFMLLIVDLIAIVGG